MASQEVHTIENDLLPRFGVGEKVLCYRGPCLFEAQCKKVRFSDDEDTYIYYVHYCGWKRFWDEWLPENKILQMNEYNVKLQRELELRHKDHVFTLSKRRSSRVEKSRNDLGEGTSGMSATASCSWSEERKTTGSSSQQPDERKTPFQFEIGEILSDRLADDWVNMHLAKKLVKLPAAVSVDQIIDAYLTARSRTHTRFEIDLFRETALGVKHYFNVMLETQILYECEVPQWKELFSECEDCKEASSVYGGIHLVRLLTRLGWAMGYTRWDVSSVKVLTTNITDFIEYITSEADKIFHDDNYFDPEDK